MSAAPDERTGVRIIKACRFIPDGLHIKVMGILEDDSIIMLFRYYPDELSFTEEELVGLSVPEAVALFHRKDEDYLRG